MHIADSFQSHSQCRYCQPFYKPSLQSATISVSSCIHLDAQSSNFSSAILKLERSLFIVHCSWFSLCSSFINHHNHHLLATNHRSSPPETIPLLEGYFVLNLYFIIHFCSSHFQTSSQFHTPHTFTPPVIQPARMFTN